MGIIGAFVKQAVWISAQHIAVNAAVNGAYKGYDAVKAGRSGNGASLEQFRDQNGNIVPFSEARVFGTPGASLMSAQGMDAGAIQAGIDGEQRVAAELETLASYYPNMYVFHSVKLPGHVGDIDHLVIQGDKMMLIDSKNWKSDAAYHVYAADQDADYISRDGQNFAGGEIHLRRQTAEWQGEFARDHLQVLATLVIANRQSTVSEAVNAPYFITNIDGVADAFSRVFYQAAVPPLHPVLLDKVMSMVENFGAVLRHPDFAPVRTLRQPATPMTKWLIGWSVFNWTIMWMLFPLAGFSAIPLLITTHVHKKKVQRENLGGNGLLTVVLVFTYVQLAAWLAFVVYAISNGGIPGVIYWR